jgi:hypothetical protein
VRWRVNVRFEVRQNNIVLIKKRLEIYKYKHERKVYSMNIETPHRISQKRLFSIYAKIAVLWYLQIWWIGEFVVALTLQCRKYLWLDI